MIAVVDYHKGNLKSVERGLIGVGGKAQITDDPAVIAQADAIVLPGVGAFADAANTMVQLGQMQVLRDRIAEGVPFLGICLGLHLMFEGGVEDAPVDEAGTVYPVAGIGALPGVVEALPRVGSDGKPYKIPHVGWNNADFVPRPGAGASNAVSSESPLFANVKDGEFFYFTHSYYAPDSPATIATTTHSITFTSAVQKGNAFGVQFHPEKSSDAGAVVLKNFVNICREACGGSVVIS